MVLYQMLFSFDLLYQNILASFHNAFFNKIHFFINPIHVRVESLAEARFAWSVSCSGEGFPMAMECQFLWDKSRVIATHADHVAQCTYLNYR